MPSTTILDASLSTSYTPSPPFIIVARGIDLAFRLLVTGSADAEVQWYFEFSDGTPKISQAEWFQEVAQNVAGGHVSMPAVVRTFYRADGSKLAPAADPYRFSANFERGQKIARIQMRALTGAVKATVILGAGMQAVG